MTTLFALNLFVPALLPADDVSGRRDAVQALCTPAVVAYVLKHKKPGDAHPKFVAAVEASPATVLSTADVFVLDSVLTEDNNTHMLCKAVQKLSAGEENVRFKATRSMVNRALRKRSDCAFRCFSVSDRKEKAAVELARKPIRKKAPQASLILHTSCSPLSLLKM